jgi:Calcium binding
MTRPDKDEEREERIYLEIVVDANGPEEQAMGWYYYLDDAIHFPFSARCVARRLTAPLDLGGKVVGMAPAEECEQEMFVLIQRKKRQLAVPLMQLEGIQVDEETRQAIED